MRTADDIFFRPGLHAGLSYLQPPPPILTPAVPARIRQFSGSDYPEVDRRIRQRFEQHWDPMAFPEVFEIASAPVLLERAHFRRHGVMIGGRWLLNGANGDRILNRLLRSAAGNGIEAALVDALGQPYGDFQPLPVEPDEDPDTPFAVTMRNGHNYYHFMTEVMPQLALIARRESRAPITIHLPDVSLLKPFTLNYIRALYPRLARRVSFSDQPTRYPRVLSVYNHRHYLYQANDPAVGRALATLRPDDPWHARSAGRRSRHYIAKSSLDLGLRLLREDALSRIADTDLAALPRRLFVGRRHAPNSPRFRENPGQERLTAALVAEGFEEVFMEGLNPLAQIATFHAADMIVAPHGAGLANMIFARRSATVVELGNPQTQIYRWGDFFQNAHVSGCRYFTVFADVNWEDPTQLPPISAGLRGALIGEQAIARVLEIVRRSRQGAGAQ